MRARILASFLDDEHRKWWTLVAVAFGLFMIMLDNTVVNVALPSIQRDLNVSVSSLEWVVNGYFLTFAVLMLTGGKLADLFARLRPRHERRDADRMAGGAGRRCGADEPRDTLDHHRHLPAAPARDGDGHLGRGLGRGARAGADHRRPARRARPLELDLLHQRPDRRARDPRRPRRDQGVEGHVAGATAGRARADLLGRRTARADLRVDRGQQQGLDLGRDPLA